MLPGSTKVQSYAGQWNVQVVRGKVTTRCLWNACRALGIGLTLLLLGTTMAVIGYYAEQLSEGDETRGNSTVHVRYESRGFHLNNLSYAGPIVMGIGGFIVVAACVMTFEARDSAAKVVPARLKPATAPSSARSTPRDNRVSRKDRRAASCQTRQSVHAHSFRRLGDVVSRSPSAPSLVDAKSSNSSKPSGEFSLLSPHLLPRQAISMDCSHVSEQVLDFNCTKGYPDDNSMASYFQQWRTVVSVQNEVKKKRLLRQKPVEDTEVQKNKKSLGPPSLRRSASTCTQTRSKSMRGDTPICRVHRCGASVSPDHRSKSAGLRRHCSMGYSPSHHRCTSPHNHQNYPPSGSVSPDAAALKRKSRSTSPCPLTSPDANPYPKPCTSKHTCPSGRTSPCSSCSKPCSSSPCRPILRTRRHASSQGPSSRSSCPPPERARSLSPSNPRGSTFRKTSLPSDASG